MVMIRARQKGQEGTERGNGSTPSGSAADHCQRKVEDGRSSSTQLNDAERHSLHHGIGIAADYVEKQVVLMRGFPARDVLQEIAETVCLFGLSVLLVTI